MAEILQDIADFQEHVHITDAVTYTTLKAYLQTAEQKYIIPYLGAQQLDELKNQTSAALTYLLPYVQKALAHFTVFLAAPDLDINVSEAGFTTSQNANMVAASAARVERFIKNQESLGWDAIEQMLTFLEANQADYPLWVAGPGYTWFNDLLLQRTADFNDCINISDSRLKFFRLRPMIKDVELLRIYPVISTDYAEAVKLRRKAGTLTAADEKVLPLIYRAVANLVFMDKSLRYEMGNEVNEFSAQRDEVISNQYRRKGEHFIGEIRNLMNQNPATDYPEYYNSSIYTPNPSYQVHDNEQSNGFFLFGSVPQ